MFSSLISRLLVVALGAMTLVACGEDWNVNQIFVSKAQNESLVSLIEQAQIAYDEGEFKDALKLAEKAEKLSPANEQIAILLGYINLSLAGMDTFRIANGLISANKAVKASDKEQSGSTSGSRGRATTFFDKLKEVLALDQATLEKLGELSSEDDLEAFADYDVILPVSAVEARAMEDVNALQRLNEAIAKICPFVDEELRMGDLDERHSEDNCVSTSTIREREVVSHFLWAFVHIAEAVVFYSVIQYQEEGREKANIELRADALQEDGPSLGVVDYAEHVVSMSTAMAAIYDVDDPDSQFNALVNDVNVAAAAFANIGQMPTKIKQALTRAVDSINDKKDEVTGDSDTEQQGNAFKNQINKQLAKSMSDQINDYAQNDPDDFAENKDELCESYITVSGGANMPVACTEED